MALYEYSGGVWEIGGCVGKLLYDTTYINVMRLLTLNTPRLLGMGKASLRDYGFVKVIAAD